MRETSSNALADWMDQRRAELGLRWADVASRAGVTTQTLREVRGGARAIRRLTKTAIERALEWQPGSVDAILAGGEPVDLTDPYGEPAPGALISDLLRTIALVRKTLGDDAASALIRGALSEPTTRIDHDRESRGGRPTATG